MLGFQRGDHTGLSVRQIHKIFWEILEGEKIKMRAGEDANQFLQEAIDSFGGKLTRIARGLEVWNPQDLDEYACK